MTQTINIRSKIFYIPLILGSLVASFYLLGIIGNFLGNFASLFQALLAAWIMSIILRPIVEYLKNKGMNDVVAIISSFCLLLIIIIGVGIFVFPSLFSELPVISRRISQINLNTLAIPYESALHLTNINLSNTFLSHIDSFISYIVNNSVSFLGNIFGVVFDLVLSFFFAFFFLLEGKEWKDNLMKIIPNQNRSDASMILEAISEGIQGFIKGQAIIALIMAICVMVAMKILGLNLIIVAGLYVFIAMIIPVVGPIICVIVPLLIAASTSLSLFIILAIILFVLSQIIVNVVQPKVLSKSLGIHPVIVVLAVIIGAQLFGFVGALLALPVASIIQSLLIRYYRYL